MPAYLLTRSFSNCRDGANLNETILRPEGIRAHGIRHLFDIDLPGDARGTEGMPLIVPGLIMRDGERHDVLFTATMGNDVAAFDANTGQRLWWQHVANPVKSNLGMDMYQIADHWGILSTPVIDLQTGTIYAVAMSSPDGQYHNTAFHLHALNLIDGSAQAAPLNLNAATYQPPNGLPLQRLGTVARKQRPGLLFDRRNGIATVFIAFGSFNEDADTNQGWVIACDVTDLKPSVAAAWTTTSRWSGGGIWMAGQGLAMTDEGHILGMNGNGSFDGITDFCECFFRLQYTPRFLAVPARLEIVDWFSPYTDTGRIGGDPTVADTSLLLQGGKERPAGFTSNMNSASDEDLGSGGTLYLPKSLTGYSKNVLMGAGKDGILYVVDADKMGRTQLASFAPDRIQREVYGALLSPPVGFTFNGVGMDLMPTDLSKLNTTPYGFTQHQHSTPVFYVSSDHGPIVLTNGENGPVRAFRFNADFTLTYLGCGAEIASPGMGPPGGMPGGMMTLSANGKNDGILWVTQSLGDANKAVVPGRLIAYAANWFVGVPGDGAMVKLWASDDWNIQFAFNKFCPPVCVNGKVYVPTYDSGIMVLG